MTYQAPCKYFNICGGCVLQHLENHGEYKLLLLKEAIDKLNSSVTFHPLIQVSTKTRRRVSFKVSNRALSFNKERNIQKIAIDDCLLLEDRLNALIMPINRLLKRIASKIEAVSMLSSDTGLELLFHAQDISSLAEDQLLIDFAREYNVARIAWQSKAQSPYLIVQLEPIQLKFNEIKIDLPINSFLQVSKESAAMMAKIILDNLNEDKQILELYSGCGSFTIPMLAKASIHAFEGSSDAIKALEQATKNYSLKIKSTQRDLYQNPLQLYELKLYSQVVINPPRNGATPQVRQMAKAKNLKKIIMVSCSVENFIRDARILIEAGFKLADIYPIDQFLYSKHLELIAVFI